MDCFFKYLNYRYIKDRPAKEDTLIVAEAYFISDFNLNYAWNNWTNGLMVENIFDLE